MHSLFTPCLHYSIQTYVGQRENLTVTGRILLCYPGNCLYRISLRQMESDPLPVLLVWGTLYYKDVHTAVALRNDYIIRKILIFILGKAGRLFLLKRQMCRI